jgi:tetratricopeptide (TPR) repeat protein/predicted Ser/Thr protein kinase
VACLDEDFFAAYFALRLSPADADRLFQHVDTCADCARLFSAIAAAQARRDFSTQPDPSGDTVAERGPRREPKVASHLGRYQIERVLGMGGMGVVYAAYDPELDRKVAIKLLRPDSQAAAGSLRARLGREAQAMARLSHPNVINVYEIGAHGDQVFVVMELIDGTTLAEWLRESERSWREIVGAFVAAGAGLEAAHAAGVVHRDFKPDNVLISRDGRVCVTDFGLARIAKSDEPPPTGASPASTLDATVTYAGQLVGTPAYMAPEQMRGEPTDARSDVFSFCVALYEALYGVRPYLGQSLDELRAAAETGKLQPPKRMVGPSEYRRAIERGLRAKPDERPASMGELLSVLRQDPIARRRRWLAAAAAAMLAIAVSVGFYQMRRRTLVCVGSEARLDGVWDSARKSQIHRAFAATSVPHAETVSNTVEKTIDHFAHAWVAMRTEACEATRLRGTQSEAMLDRRMHCLDDRLNELRALTDVLAKADAPLVQKAAQATDSLLELERCSDLTELSYELEPPKAAQRAEVESVRARAAKVSALAPFNRFDEMESILPGLVDDAQRLGYWPALADAHAAQAQAAVAHDRLEEAITALHDSALSAERTRYDRAAFHAWFQLSQIERWRGRPAEALLWSRYAEVVCDRLATCPLRPLLLADRARLHSADGHRAEAVAEARRALALLGQTREGDYDAIDTRGSAATVLADAGFVDEAIAIQRSALAEAERAFGRTNQMTVGIMMNLASFLILARSDEALPLARSSYELILATFGPDAIDTGSACVILGQAQEAAGDLAGAHEHLKRALDNLEKNGIGGPNVVEVLTHLGQVEHRLGRPEAQTTLARALSAGESAHLGAGELAATRLALAQALPARDHARAVALATQARDAFAAAAKSGDASAAAQRDQADAWLKRPR